MLIECGKCGAPLDVTEGQTIAKCRYCGASSRVGRTRTIAERTPADWRAPQTWQPPPQGAAAARRNLVGIAAGAAVFVGLVSLIAAVQMNAGNGLLSAPRATSAEFAAISPASSLEQLKRRFAFGTVDERRISLALDDPRWSMTTLDFAPDGSHIVAVYLHPIDAGLDRRTIVAGLEPLVGRRFRVSDDNTYVELEEGRLHVGENGSLSFGVEVPDEDTELDWRAVMVALWTLMRVAYFEAPPASLDAATRERLSGYTLARAATAEVTGTVEGAFRTVAAVLPATSANLSSGLSVKVPLDHPWFRSVTLTWKNEPNGRLESMQIWSLRERFEDPEAIARCLTPLAGEPEVSVSDHLRNERTWRWNHGSGWWERGIGIYRNSITARMAPGPDLQDHYRAILTTLDRCGR